MIGTCVLAALGVAATTAGDGSQQSIQWVDVEAGSAQAERSHRAVLFYLVGRKGDAGGGDAAQQQALSQASVVSVVQRSYVPVRLPRSSMSETILEQMKVPDAPLFSILISTPKGRLVGNIPPDQVAKPDVLARELTDLSREFRSDRYEKHVKPVLATKSAKPEDQIKALKLVADLSITGADEDVAGLLKRKDLPAEVKGQVYATLAALSTEKSTEVLFGAALTDPAAAEALGNCRHDVAGVLLKKLPAGDAARRSLAYKALVKMYGIPDAKPAEFWKDSNKEAQNAEIERVRKAVGESARPAPPKPDGTP